jgi:hypothetical protein
VHSGDSRSPIEREVKTESTRMIDGPNGLGGIETVTVSINGVSSSSPSTLAPNTSSPAPGADLSAELRAEGGVTQGELLRQEQRAGVVPVAQLVGNRGDSDGKGEEDETPHARGPDEIGMEDTGPQAGGKTSMQAGQNVSMKGIDVDAAVGRSADVEEEKVDEKEAPGTPKREAEDEIGGEEKKVREDVEMGETEEEKDEVDLVDVDGKKEGEKKVGQEGENKGVDGVDGSTV